MNETQTIQAAQTMLPLKSGKRNYITRIQATQLHGWLQSLGDEISQRSAGELARRATEKLGFTVTLGNVANLRRQMGCGPGKRTGGRGAKKLSALQHERTLELIGTVMKQVSGCRNTLDAALDNLHNLHLLVEGLR